MTIESMGAVQRNLLAISFVVRCRCINAVLISTLRVWLCVMRAASFVDLAIFKASPSHVKGYGCNQPSMQIYFNNRKWSIE